ncbi:MAG: non-canonical purine NTP pyrophosphatase, RdgB/HAM1 family [Deltaproteobacteria bacterium HGW-Deltaproteobacteria-17]|nr:MAG: non-canonical purine NTP pyrophosphatase, RdgB/HAM1 family [Deltaproteobacteria bacterium HGW-Deltaproteobacteria-17]
MKELLAATSNPHKLHELRAIFAPLGVGVLGLGDIPGGPFAEPIEDGGSFESNARIKAVAYARMTGRVCVADDSGLEVLALGGAPGVDSAYYAGRDGTRAQRDARNNAKLLAALAGVPEEQRTARFVCSMCAADPDGSVLATSRGEFTGRIGFEARGVNGFGYDPLFVTSDGRTSAELSDAEKNARSHRGAAARAMAPILAPTPGKRPGAGSVLP